MVPIGSIMGIQRLAGFRQSIIQRRYTKSLQNLFSRIMTGLQHIIQLGIVKVNDFIFKLSKPVFKKLHYKDT